jgi:EmrB/QacA subfamily drug resistance transporter
VLGSGIAFLDGTVVNVALPAIGEEFGASIGGMQWTLNAYLVTLSALILLGGGLGDRYGRRRVFIAGLLGFTVASLFCGLAPSIELLIAARALQGVGGALLVPSSLAIISATFHPDDRGRAIGAWSGLSGVSSAIGPFVGGWLIDAVSWRLVFLINVPIAAVAIAITVRHVPETRSTSPDGTDTGPLDLPGAALVSIGLGSISYAAIEQRGTGALLAGLLGIAAIAAFLLVQHRSANPMMPLGIFRSRQFSGANATTFAVYAGLGGAMFLVVVQLQTTLGYSALEAGASLVPFTVLMLLLSPAAGQLGRAIGPRIPMTIGPIAAGAGLLLLSGISAGDRYVPDVAGGVVVFGLGMALTVAPLTAAVLGGVEDRRVGIASGINNAVARLAGLLAVAALPALAGMGTTGSVAQRLDQGYATALQICAGLCVAGGIVAAVLMRTGVPTRPVVHPGTNQACNDPSIADPRAGEERRSRA